MYNVEVKNELTKAFLEEVEAKREKNLLDLDMGGYMKKGRVDLVRECISKIQSNVVASIPVGLAVPKFSLYITPIGEEEITMISITATNKVTGKKQFKYSVSVYENVVDTVLDFMQNIYLELLVDSMMESNLEVVNEVLAEAAVSAGLGYEISVTSPLGMKDKKISYIGDDAIVFVCDEDRIFELEDVLVFSEVAGLVTEEHIANAKKQIAENLGTMQTPEQLVQNHGGVLIEYLCDINKHVKAMTLIKKVYNKNALKVLGNKDTFAYFHQDNIFSIVARREGVFEVILSPFDTETFRKVDFDVLKAIS